MCFVILAQGLRTCYAKGVAHRRASNPSQEHAAMLTTEKVIAMTKQLNADFAATRNAAAKTPWWSNAVVYQIYPRSFQDANGDGIGDIQGITRRLPYVAELGIDVIWLCPMYVSPQDDNGYDIADYQNIDPMFGTLDDMDELLRTAHSLGLKVIMDLVVNHSSDEHAWFIESRDKTSDKADWYWWMPAKEGHVPGEIGAEPNSWGSYFGGSAWTYDPQRGEYFFHQFSAKQPDLNWERPELRQAVYEMMNWWMDRGIDGFRMDVISQISKTLDSRGMLPGTDGSDKQIYPVGSDGYSSPFDFCTDGPRLDEFLHEMYEAVFAGREGFLTVGEGPGISITRAAHITNPASEELDMLFLFDHVGIDDDGPAGKWSVVPWKVRDLRNVFAGYEEIVRDGGWTSLFYCNHDQPRVVSRWGDDSTEELRSRSAKALGLVLHMHKGTPYIYQGEELGMTNAGFTSLDQYRDVESLNHYRQYVEESGILTHDEMMSALALKGRDNSRTPMQWDETAYAGFIDEDAGQAPWISVNANKDVINARRQQDDPDSVYHFFKRLIELRHTKDIVVAGDWELIAQDSDSVYAFTRHLGNESLVVVANLSSDTVELPTEVAELVGEPLNERVLITNQDAALTCEELQDRHLRPWTAFAYILG